MAPSETFDDENDDEIPLVDDTMLHPSVNFEAGMSWLPLVTIILILYCAIAFGFEVATGALEKADRLLEMGALSRAKVEAGELWRLHSAAFLHASPDHLIGNMLMLFVLGMACEHAYGRSQFVFIYMVVALGGSCASMLDDKMSVGASGAIFGLAGALIALFQRYRARLKVRDHRIGFVVGVWALYQIAMGATNPHIDNFCHLGGFVTGIIVGIFMPLAILNDREEFDRRPSCIVQLAVGCTVLGAMSIWFIPRMFG